MKRLMALICTLIAMLPFAALAEDLLPSDVIGPVTTFASISDAVSDSLHDDIKTARW